MLKFEISRLHIIMATMSDYSSGSLLPGPISSLGFRQTGRTKKKVRKLDLISDADEGDKRGIIKEEKLVIPPLCDLCV